MEIKESVSLGKSNEEIVRRYFNCIERKDLAGLLDLFADDAVITEPFSKEKVLRGHSAIEPFLKVAFLANSTLKRKIKIQKLLDKKGKEIGDAVKAIVTFEKGDTIEGTFTFEFTSGIIDVDAHSGRSTQTWASTHGRKIKKLTIQFAS